MSKVYQVAIIATSSSITPLKDGSSRPSGCWYEELAAPFLVFNDNQNFEASIYSIQGGKIPFDAGSLNEPFFTDDCKRFSNEFSSLVESTKSISDAKDEIMAKDILFFPGGHACYSDLHDDVLVSIITGFYNAGKIISAVCHGPVAFCNPALKKQDGSYLVAGHYVTCFTDDEEKALDVHNTIPYSVQQKLLRLGGSWQGAENWKPHVVVSKNILTGQNPASSKPLALQVVEVAQQ